MNGIFKAITAGGITPSVFFICTGVSLVLGLLLALSYMFRNTYSKSFVLTVALLPVTIQVVMMLVNGNLGTGVAVMGAFSLIRFRSVPGSAKEILAIFTAMAVGLATGVGYLAIAVIFTVVIILATFGYTVSGFGNAPAIYRQLRITIPESLDYTEVFDDLFAKYTIFHELIKVRTANMGCMYQLTYQIKLRSVSEEKAFLDDIRCRNGNLDIMSSRLSSVNEEL